MPGQEFTSEPVAKLGIQTTECTEHTEYDAFLEVEFRVFRAFRGFSITSFRNEISSLKSEIYPLALEIHSGRDGARPSCKIAFSHFPA